MSDPKKPQKPLHGLSADEVALRAQHRQQRAAEGRQDGRTTVQRIDPAAALAGRGATGALARAMKKLSEDPELAAQLERERIADAAATFDEVQQMRRRNRWAAYEKTRVSMYRSATYEDLRDPGNAAAAKVLGWWRSGARTLVLAGEPGRGKTHAAYAICNEVAAADRDGTTSVPASVRAYQVSALRDLLVPRGAHEARDEVAASRRARALADVRECDLLLLDDLTAANVTDWFRESIHALVDARVTGNNKRTIVTVNAPSRKEFMPTMVDRLGQAIVSRLNDDAVYAWLDGPDRRQTSDWDPFS